MAAAAEESAKKLELLLECPICMETLNQPKVFHCLHVFCTSCVGDLKPKTIASEQCYECPTCRQSTPVHKLRHMHFIHDLLEIMALAKQGQKMCDKCKDHAATHRCLDCKENFCEVCRAQHLGFSILQHHTWQELSASDQPVLDKHIHCEIHSGEIVKLHCKDCQKLICLLCNGTEHKLHHAETIDEAIKNLLPIVTKRTEEVKTQISVKEKALSDVQDKKRVIRKQYDDIESSIDAKCQAIIAKAREDCKMAKQYLTDRKHTNIKMIEELEERLEVQLKGQRNIVALSETALASTQGTSLLQAMQSGILESLQSQLQHEDIPDIDGNVKVKFQPAMESFDNIIGNITDKKEMCDTSVMDTKGNITGTLPHAQAEPGHSRLIKQTLTDVTKQTFGLQKTVEVGNNCHRMTNIDNNIWFIRRESRTCEVYSMNGTKGREIAFQSIGHCRSIVKAGSGLAVASSQGLHLSDMNGIISNTLLQGDFVDVTSCGDIICALNNRDGTVYVLKLGQEGNSATKMNEIKMQNYKTSYNLNTISMTHHFLYVAIRYNHEILKYTHNGTLLSKHGGGGKAVGQLDHPRLCGADRADTLLIADAYNHRMKTLTADGKWYCLDTVGLKEPSDAIIENDKLIVAQWNKLKLYSIH